MQHEGSLTPADQHCEICADPVGPWHLLRGGRIDQCRSCGHVMRSLEDCPADHRDHAYGGDPSLDKARLALTYRALATATMPGSVFEIGFGAGALLRRFSDAGVQIAGVDPDQLDTTVDPVVARKGTLWSGTMESVPDGVYRADLVYGVHVIEHVEDPLAVMRKAGSLLKPGGRLVLLTPAADSWGLKTFGSAWWMLEDPTHIRFFTESSLRLAASKTGFQNVRVDRLVMDSLTSDVASAARMVRRTTQAGALDDRRVLGAALATAPAVAALRWLVPKTRATLRLTADWPAE